MLCERYESKKKQGLTLLEALETYSDPEALRQYQKFKPYYQRRVVLVLGAPPTDTELKEDRARELRRPLEDNLVRMLQQGDLVAYAHVVPLRADAERVEISSEKWKLLTIDFDKSTATGYGLQLLDIRIGEPKRASRGRKAEKLSLNQEIHAAFSQLLEQGKVCFKRGGLIAAAEELANQFPAYRPDSIRKIIQPAYNEAKHLKEQTDK